MIGDRPVTLFAFFAAVCFHLVVLLLMSYMPIAKLEQPAPSRRTRYVVQFRQPISTTAPTSVPVPRTPTRVTPTLPVPEKPLPRQPAQPQEPVRVRPRHERTKVPHTPRLSPIPQVQRPDRVTARKPSDVKVQQIPQPSTVRPPKQPSPPKPKTASQPTPPSTSEAPRTSPPQPSAPAEESDVRPSKPAVPPAQELQNQYLAMISEAIQRHKRYPRMARRRGLSGRVVLEFVILRNGHITQARVLANHSTRHNILHQAALRALEQASPFPPFPETLQKLSWRITLPMLYELAER